MDSADLPSDISLMRATTTLLQVIAALLCLGTVGLWALRHEAWSVKSITLHGQVAHQDLATLHAQLAGPMKELLAANNLFTLDVQPVKQLFESMPWVEHALVQREFPDRLRITLKEHSAVAWWGQTGSGQLLNPKGRVFEANPQDNDELPELAGPRDQSAHVWAFYQALHTQLAPSQMRLARLELNERGSWSGELDNGTHIELGRGTTEALIARVQRFTGTIGQLTERYASAIESVDLRYPNGYALRMRGVSTLAQNDKNPSPTTP